MPAYHILSAYHLLSRRRALKGHHGQLSGLLAAKKPEDQLFETMDATDLNKTLKDLMDGLSVKVFRTYNASITLDRLLWEPSDSEVVDAKKADYDRANKEVRIPCFSQAAKGVAVIFCSHLCI